MSKKILIVDDDKDFTGIISDFLTDYGYDVSLAYDETSAYSLLQDNKFHLIILDINLPETTGFEICKELRRISDETNLDYGIDKYTYQQFCEKYGSKVGLSNLYDALSRIAEEEKLDFNLGNKEEWIASFETDHYGNTKL